MRADLERVLREFDSVYRRVRSLEMRMDEGAVSQSSQRKPLPGFIWHEAETGKLRVWNGSSWDVYSKDV